MTGKQKYSIKFLQDSLTIYTDHLEELRKYSALSSVIKKLAAEIKEIDTVGQLNENILQLTITYDSMLQLQGFLRVSLLDIIVILKNSLTVNDKWEKPFYLRHGSMLIYEALKTYSKYTKMLNQILQSRYIALKPSFEDITKRIRKFKKEYEYESLIANVRHNTTAHINENFLQYCKVISSIEGDRINSSFFEFHSILTQLSSFLLKISQYALDELFSILGKNYEDYFSEEEQEKDDWFDQLLSRTPRMLK